MNWAAIGAVSEVIAAIAVVVSLVYVGTQIRQATKIARASTRNAIAESAQALTSDLIGDAKMAEILVRHLNGEELNPVDKLRLEGRCYRDLRHWENIYYQVREGLMTTEEWEGFRKNLALMLAIEAYRQYWQFESELYSEAFREEIDLILQESPKVQESVRLSERFDQNSPGQGQ